MTLVFLTCPIRFRFLAVMKACTRKIYNLYRQPSLITEALVGLIRVKEAKGEDPNSCVYVTKAEDMFYETEAENFINKLKEIINEFEYERVTR